MIFINKLIKKKVIILFFLIVSILIIGIIIANISGIFANGLAPANSLGGDKNIFISYLGPNKSLVTKDEYKRLFAYYKTDGTTNYETFMDSVIIMPTTSYSSSKIDLYQGHDYIHSNSNRDFQDSVTGMNKFDSTVIVDEIKELENIEQTITELNNSCIADHGTNCNRKIDIYLGVYEPKINDINTLIKHFVDKQITEFNKKNFQNLNLAGFYYVTEQIHKDDENVARYFNSYVHSIKDANNKSIYKTIWCPYYGAPGGHHSISNYVYSVSSSVSENEKFDFTSAQTNYYFKSDSSNEYSTEYLTNSNTAAYTYGYGLEVELDSNVICDIYQNYYFSKYIKWLKYAVENRWNSSINMYYAPTSLVDVSKSKIIQERNIYDFTYKYAKGTLTLPELDITYKKITVSSNDYFDTSSFKNLVGENTTISMSGAFTSQTSSSCTSYDYCSATEETLRDGVFGRKNYGSSWVVFHENMNSPYKIVVDLKSKQTSLTNFGIEYANIPKDDIKVPAEVNISVSDNNITYNKCDIANVSEKNRAYSSYFNYDTKTSCSGRYIKFDFTPQSHAMLISEVVVGQTADIKPNKTSTEIIKGLSEDIIVSTNGGNLSATSNDSTIASCSIIEDNSGDKLHIVGIKAGTTTCTLTEDKYNRTTSVNITVINESVSSISIEKEPTKKDYYIGDNIDLTGGKLKVVYNNNTSKSINLSDSGVSVTGFDSSTIGEKTLTVSYGGKTCTYTVTVEKGVEEPYLNLDSSLLVIKPDNIIYNLGLGNSINSILGKINTNCEIKVFKDTTEITSGIIKTGYKIKATWPSKNEEYMLSVKGDISGDGISDITDVIQAANYIVNKNNQELTVNEKAKRKAGDMNDDNKLDITDVVQLSRLILKK